jgi:hypothetical protein
MNEDQWGLKKKKKPTKWPFFSVKKNIFQCFNNNKNTINFSFQQDLHFPPPLPSTSSHYLPRKESNNLPIFNSLKLFNASGIVNPLSSIFSFFYEVVFTSSCLSCPLSDISSNFFYQIWKHPLLFYFGYFYM